MSTKHSPFYDMISQISIFASVLSLQTATASSIIYRNDNFLLSPDGGSVSRRLSGNSFLVSEGSTYTGAGVYVSGLDLWDGNLQYFFVNHLGVVDSGLGVDFNRTDTGLLGLLGKPIYRLDFNFDKLFTPDSVDFSPSPWVDLYFGVHLGNDYSSPGITWTSNRTGYDWDSWTVSGPDITAGSGTLGTDLAFYLKGTSIPEPSSTLLAISGGILLVTRRKRSGQM